MSAEDGPGKGRMDSLDRRGELKALRVPVEVADLLQEIIRRAGSDG